MASPRPRSGLCVTDFAVGETVVYRPEYGPEEYGVVTGVGSVAVFVRYRPGQVGGTPTRPQDLFKTGSSRPPGRELRVRVRETAEVVYRLRVPDDLDVGDHDRVRAVVAEVVGQCAAEEVRREVTGREVTEVL